ncbi:chorismate synthase [Deferribacterales bacterium RsTz2092]|nr:chorismate synthase [Deferribacterales bacterium]
MGANSYGQYFTVTTFGESHGGCIGVVVDGCPAGLEITEKYIDNVLEKRRASQAMHSTTRMEPDLVEVISGVFEGKSTGAPITLIIRNTDVRSGDYESLKSLYRPGHIDWTHQQKYGHYDYRGGGRGSGRETAARVAAGAIAKLITDRAKVECQARVVQIGGIAIGNTGAIERLYSELREQGDSVGGLIELVVKNVPVGLGEPVFDKLSAQLAYAIMGIPAVKGVEVGSGFESAKMRGSEHNDKMRDGKFLTNNAGGILGGISTGADIVLRVAVKPPSSISIEQETITKDGRNTTFKLAGRHDVCIAPRAVAVVEAMAYITLADFMVR